MKAIVYDAPREFSLVDVPDPVPGPGEVVVRTTLAGVCGTDLHIHEGGFFTKFPLTPGHEITGEVLSYGEGVEGFERASGWSSTTPPPAATAPSAGAAIRCSAATSAPSASTPPAASPSRCSPPPTRSSTPTTSPPDLAVLAEPLACAVHGMDVLDLKPGADVVMIGSGTTGLLLAQLLIHGGAGRLTVAGPTQFKLDLAKQVRRRPRGAGRARHAEATAATLTSSTPAATTSPSTPPATTTSSRRCPRWSATTAPSSSTA